MNRPSGPGGRAARSVAAGIRSSAFAALALAAASVCGGCVERVLVVESDPPGARVWVNGALRGTTPARVRYVHEGRFDVRVEKEGYESVASEVTTRTGIDAVPGPDFVAENVFPGVIRRRTLVRLRLPPLKPQSYTREELAALVARAEGFRARAKAAASEPGTPLPTPPGRRSTSPVQPLPGPPPTR